MLSFMLVRKSTTIAAGITLSLVAFSCNVTPTESTNQFTLQYTASPNGSLQGLEQQLVLEFGSGTEVTAIANGGYIFHSWSDGIATPARTDSNITADLQVTASFVPDDQSFHILQYSAGLFGSITGESNQTISHGSDASSVTALADDGYQFVMWSDGVLTASRTDVDVQTNQDLAASFRLDSRVYPIERDFSGIPTANISKPALMVPLVDANYGTTTLRITDATSQNDPLVNQDGNRVLRANAHPYPKTQAWNKDMSLLHFRYRFYDAETFEELAITSGTDNLTDLYNINGSLSEMKWSSLDPNVFFGVYGSAFWKATIDRQAQSISFVELHDFSETSYDKFTLGKFEGNIDYFDHYVVFAARKTGTKYLTAIVYDMQKAQVLATEEFPNEAWPDEGQVFDWISVSPLGNHILMSSNDRIDQYDLTLAKVRSLATSGGHGDLGIDSSGNEIYMQYEYGDDIGIWMYQLRDGSRSQLLPDKYNGGHISCRNYERPGWCYISTTSEEYREVVAVQLDASGPTDRIVNRFAQTHTSGHNSFGGASPDGTRVIFSSDWDEANVHEVDRDSYHVTVTSP